MTSSGKYKKRYEAVNNMEVKESYTIDIIFFY